MLLCSDVFIEGNVTERINDTVSDVMKKKKKVGNKYLLGGNIK